MREWSPCGIASAMHEDYCTAQDEASIAKQQAVSMLQEMKLIQMKSWNSILFQLIK